jgi:hypothetical protein
MTKPNFVLTLSHLSEYGVQYPPLTERGYDAAEVFDALEKRVIGHGWIKRNQYPNEETARVFVKEEQDEAEPPAEPTHPSPLDLQDLEKWFADQDQSIPLVQAIATAATEAIAKLVRADKIKRLEAELHQLKHFPKGPKA